MSGPTASYEAVCAAQLRLPDVAIGESLHNETLTTGGKIFAFLKGDRLVVKVPAARVAALIAEGRGQPFTAGGRTMREWVAVTHQSRAGWLALADEAREFVGGARPR